MEYPKIETLFKRDENFKVIPTELRNPCVSLIKTWQFTEKIDGTNIRLIWKDKKLSIGGSADFAQLSTSLVTYLYDSVNLNKLEELFPGTDAIIYGEGCGAGIQKNGGYYNKAKHFVVFDVLVNNYWLDWNNVCDVANKLALQTVPFLGEMSLQKGVKLVKTGFNSILAQQNTGTLCLAEGLVGRTREPLYDKFFKRLIIKLKTQDFRK